MNPQTDNVTENHSTNIKIYYLTNSGGARKYMPQPVRISLMRSTAGTASKHSNAQKTVVEDGVNKLPEAAKEERKR